MKVTHRACVAISTALVLGNTSLERVETVTLMAQTKSRLEIAGGKLSATTASANTPDVLINTTLIIILKCLLPLVFSK